MRLSISKNIDNKVVNKLAQNYSTLAYPSALKQKLQSLYPIDKLENLPKYKLQKLLNDILLQHYNGEAILKYKLFELYKLKEDIICAFEINVNSSRLDFLAVNGHSTSFEVKSELDNLSKLQKQVNDYNLVFEYNNIFVDELHISTGLPSLPNNYGIWSYKDGVVSIHKKPKLNKSIDCEMQLRLFNKIELNHFFKGYKGEIGAIIYDYNEKQINKIFKLMLKNRYTIRWDFLRRNSVKVMPMDVQFFFKMNIHPDSIYC